MWSEYVVVSAVSDEVGWDTIEEGTARVHFHRLLLLSWWRMAVDVLAVTMDAGTLRLNSLFQVEAGIVT
jgi:hypothetical protein